MVVVLSLAAKLNARKLASDPLFCHRVLLGAVQRWNRVAASHLFRRKAGQVAVLYCSPLYLLRLTTRFLGLPITTTATLFAFEYPCSVHVRLGFCFASAASILFPSRHGGTFLSLSTVSPSAANYTHTHAHTRPWLRNRPFPKRPIHAFPLDASMDDQHQQNEQVHARKV